METTQTQETRITKDMTIALVFKKFPGKAMRLADTMTAAGLNCVGCGASGLETLEQGILGHGKSQEEVEVLVGKLNDILHEELGDDLTLTDVAAKKVKKIMQEEQGGETYLKVGIVEAGCAGYAYDLNFSKEKEANDVVIEDKGVKLLVAQKDEDKFKGVQIDYTEGLQGTGFRFSNPNVKKSCGCGSTVGF